MTTNNGGQTCFYANPCTQGGPSKPAMLSSSQQAFPPTTAARAGLPNTVCTDTEMGMPFPIPIVSCAAGYFMTNHAENPDVAPKDLHGLVNMPLPSPYNAFCLPINACTSSINPNGGCAPNALCEFCSVSLRGFGVCFWSRVSRKI